MSDLSISLSEDYFKPITEELDSIFALPHDTDDDIKAVLAKLEESVKNLDRTYFGISTDRNILSVQCAAIIGKICNHVRFRLLHGEWSLWARENFTESLKTLEKFMAIARSGVVGAYARLSTERVYQLTRIEHLLKENRTFEDVFSSSGLDTSFESYSCKEFEVAVTVILNKDHMQELDIEISNEAIKSLSENFNLIKDNHNILSRLAEARSEDANLEKAVTNIVATGGGKKSLKKSKGVKHKEDVNAVAEAFIRKFQEAMDDPDSHIDDNRIHFIAKLIQEYFQRSK